jgi:O-antigen/teichoic acid export membrane protein
MSGPEVAPTPGAAPEGLRARAARGTIINTAFSVGLHTIGFFKSFAVAALLTTTEYGVWGILVISIGTLTWLKDVGINDKFIQQEEGDQELAFQKAFTLEAIADGLLFVLITALLPVFVLIYGEWDLLLPGLVIMATFPAMPLRASIWVYYREMRFARQRAMEAIDPLVSLVVTIVLAIAGFGYWSLVLGYFAGAWVTAIAAVAFSPYKLAWRYDRATMREYFSFSWPLLASNGSVILIPQLGMIVGEAKLGLSGAGYISLAGTIATYTDKVDAILSETLYPAVCRVRDRAELLLEAFVKTNRLDLMWGIPFGVAVALFAPDLVDFAIGDKWEPAVGLLQVLALTSAANHFGYNWTVFLRAIGDTKPIAKTSFVVVAVFLVTAVPLLAIYGLEGYAVGMAIMVAVSLVARGYYLRKLFPTYNFALEAARAVAPVVPAAGAVLGLRLIESGDRTLALAIGEGVLFVALTVIATWFTERGLLREMIGYLRGRSRPISGGAPA